MRGWIYAAVVAVAGAACRPSPPAPVLRPPPLVATPAFPRKTLVELVERPAVLAPADPLERQVPSLAQSLPRAPVILPLVRPRTGGDALALADLAFARGDAVDAAAQYRALLDRATPSYAPYVQVQLARAYLTLGEDARARPLLRAAAAASGPEAWVALTRLAELRAGEVGAVAAADELRLLAGGRADALVDNLIHASPPDAGALLLLKASRTHICGQVLAAIVRWPEVPDRLSSECHLAAELARARLVGRDRALAYQRRFDDAAATWNALAASVLAGDVAPEPWLALAEEYIATGRLGGHPSAASRGASAAVFIAIDLVGRSGRFDAEQRSRLDVIINQLDDSDRGVGRWLLTQLVRRNASSR